MTIAPSPVRCPPHPRHTSELGWDAPAHWPTGAMEGAGMRQPSTVASVEEEVTTASDGMAVNRPSGCTYTSLRTYFCHPHQQSKKLFVWYVRTRRGI